MIYNRKLKGLLPFILTYFIFYFVLMFVLLIGFGIKSGFIFFFVLFGIPYLFIFSVYRFIRLCLRINYYQITNKELIFVSQKKEKILMLWNDINEMRFASASYSGAIEFLGGKNFGYYEVIDKDNNKICIPPAVENRDILVREIVKRAKLIKELSTIQKSLLGSFLGTQRYRGDFVHWEKCQGEVFEYDADISPRKFSSFSDYLIVVIVVIAAFIFVIFGLYYFNR